MKLLKEGGGSLSLNFSRMFSFCLKYFISDVSIEYKEMPIEENQKTNLTYMSFF